MNRILRLAAICIVATAMGSCGASRWEKPTTAPAKSAPVSQDMTRTKRGNPPFYEVFGVRYQVMRSSVGYKDRGIASWYGKKFHGRQTSNGERYDMYRLTAAHKTLPLPTNVRVTNLNNGRSVVVRVNDRGPFVGNRLIDLSYEAARQLDMIDVGTALVEIEALEAGYTDAITDVAPAAAENSPAEIATALNMYVQVGAFGEAGNAHTLATLLTENGVDKVAVREPIGTAAPLYRVRIGPLSSITDYDRIVVQMARLQIAETQLVVEHTTESSATPIEQ